MAEQLVLDLPIRPAMGRDDFYVSEANRTALAMIDGWRDWPFGKLVLVGDTGSGKTHLAQVWAAQAGARQLVAGHISDDDIAEPTACFVEGIEAVAGERAAEEALFHLHNAMVQEGLPLLITARRAPSRWGLGLPDLASRMAQASLARLEPPDDALLLAVMLKQAIDLKLDLTPAMFSYLGARVPRSFQAAHAVIQRLHELALSARKRRPRQEHLRIALAELTDDPSS